MNNCTVFKSSARVYFSAFSPLFEIDIAGLAVQHGNRQLAVLNEYSGRLLIRVAAVF